jgi:hypothetical protein
MPKAGAVCLSAGTGSNCGSFNSDTLSYVTQEYTSTNLNPNQYFQIGFRSSDSNSYSIQAIEYSLNNSSWTSFTSSSISASGSYSYSPIINLNIAAPFYVRYTLPVGIPLNAIIDSRFVSNNNGAQSGGILSDVSGNNYLAVVRSSTSVPPAPVPAPLPVVGAVAAFAHVRRLRRASHRLHT